MAVQFWDGKILFDDGKVAMDSACCCETSGACYKLIPCTSGNTCGDCDPALEDAYEVTFTGMANSDNNGTYVMNVALPACYWDATPDDYFTLIWDGVTNWWVETYGPPYTDFELDVDECDGPVGTYTVNTGQGNCVIEPYGTNTTVTGQIIVTDDLSAVSGIIGYDDECYDIVGETECISAITMGTYSEYDTCSACYDDIIPDSCPTLTADYEIDGYVAGDLDGCAGCYDDSNAPWDGLYKHTNGCTWIIDYGGSYSSVSDKLLGTTSQIRFFASTKWTVNVVCYGAAGNITIWEGEKTTGGTPVGVYTRTDGCDMTSSISLVEA